jgi:transcriptional regulator with XRE-family HTH domain
MPPPIGRVIPTAAENEDFRSGRHRGTEPAPSSACIFRRWQALAAVVGSLYDCGYGNNVTSDREKFGVRLRTLRAAAGFESARLFAEALGINENTYSRYERGQSEPDFQLIKKICDRLKITPNDLFGGEPLLSRKPDGDHDHPGFSELESKPSDFRGTAERGPVSLLTTRRREPGSSAQPDQLSVLTWRFAEAYARATMVDARRKRAKDQTQVEFICLQESAKLFMRLRTDLLATIAQLVVSEQLSKSGSDERARVQKAADELLRVAMQAADSPPS